MTETRKLAAILVADVVGYSRLAGADEDRTLARLRSLRGDLIDPAIAAHHGRIVKRCRVRAGLVAGNADAADEGKEGVGVVCLQQHRLLLAHIAQRVRHTLGQRDVVAGAGDEGVVTAPHGQLPAQEVEAVVDVVMHVERRRRTRADVVLDDDRQRALG